MPNIYFRKGNDELNKKNPSDKKSLGFIKLNFIFVF
tara:strand:- start:1 stop:108 length:108 start_codon:yes stop_codon:yes gene_type:complete